MGVNHWRSQIITVLSYPPSPSRRRAEGGHRQLNALKPIIAYSLLASLEHFGTGITDNRDLLQDRVAASIGTLTALAPALGYQLASTVDKEALLMGAGVSVVALARGLMTRDEIELTEFNFPHGCEPGYVYAANDPAAD